MKINLPSTKNLTFFSSKILFLIFLLLVLLTFVTLSIKLISNQPKVSLTFTTSKTDYYNFEKLKFDYTVTNPTNQDLNNVSLSLSLCSIDKTECKNIFNSKEIVPAYKYLKRNEETVLFNKFSDFGTHTVVLSLFFQDQPNKVLAQQEQTVNLKDLAPELFVNLTTNGEFFSSGDFVKLKYIFKNQTSVVLSEQNFSLTLNYAGPVERAANTGKLIADLSQDIDSQETVSGEESWVLANFPNRLGGIYNVSLFLGYKNEDGTVTRITDVVKQIQWP